jgi:hypothetical protein
MSDGNTEDTVYQRVQLLFQQGTVRDPLVSQKGKLVWPIPVHSPQGKIDSWFVAVTVEGRIVGFFQLAPDLTLQRYASFLRRPGSIEGSPLAGTWLDPEQITARASTLLQPGETAELLHMTYDRNPDRLAWQVNVRAPEGVTRTIFVAGEYVYQKK